MGNESYLGVGCPLAGRASLRRDEGHGTLHVDRFQAAAKACWQRFLAVKLSRDQPEPTRGEPGGREDLDWLQML